jgi:hypothetical protein
MLKKEQRTVSTTNLFIGCDPGLAGGISIIKEDGEVISYEMPCDEKDTWQLVQSYSHDPSDGTVPFAVIEQVGGYMPGSKGNIGSAMFTFGMATGWVRMALTAAKIPWSEVHPRTWQKALGVQPRKKEESKAQFKKRLREIAGRLFPSANVMAKTADSILLSEYCRRLRTGTL